MNEQLIAQTKDDLDSPFTFLIEKAEALEEGSDLIISGVASSTNVDHDSERMSLNALQQMANKINSDGVPLRIEHQKSDEAIVGEVISAEVDSRNRLLIKAKVKKTNPAGIMLHTALKGGLKMGFSVGGRVKRAFRELAEGAGKLVKTFYDIHLDEVSVTPRPANYDSWADSKYGLVAKSTSSGLFYNQFLTENPKLDYLAVIEKSIPETAWEKVEIKNQNTNMDKLKKTSSSTEEEKAESMTSETEEKAESTSSETGEKAESSSSESSSESSTKEKYASMDFVKAEINSVKAQFGEVISLLKSLQKATDMTSSTEEKDRGPETTQDEASPKSKPHQQNDPDEETKDPEANKAGENGTETHERESGKGGELHNEAMDQEDPDQKKVDPEAGKSAKKMKKAWPPKDSSESEEKAESSQSSDSDSDSETGSTKENSYGNEYKLSAVADALKSRGNMSNLDAFVAYVVKTMEDMKDSLKSHNKRVLGLEKSIAEQIKNDESIQKSIHAWMREPGPKKSVSLGVPYAVTKEGMRLRLVPDDFTIAKSIDKKSTFKQAWGANFASKDFE